MCFLPWDSDTLELVCVFPQTKHPGLPTQLSLEHVPLPKHLASPCLPSCGSPRPWSWCVFSQTKHPGLPKHAASPCLPSCESACEDRDTRRASPLCLIPGAGKGARVQGRDDLASLGACFGKGWLSSFGKTGVTHSHQLHGVWDPGQGARRLRGRDGLASPGAWFGEGVKGQRNTAWPSGWTCWESAGPLAAGAWLRGQPANTGTRAGVQGQRFTAWPCGWKCWPAGAWLGGLGRHTHTQTQTQCSGFSYQGKGRASKGVAWLCASSENTR